MAGKKLKATKKPKGRSADAFDVDDLYGFITKAMEDIVLKTMKSGKDLNTTLSKMQKDLAKKGYTDTFEQAKAIAKVVGKSSEIQKILSKKGGATLADLTLGIKNLLALSDAEAEVVADILQDTMQMSRYIRDFAAEAADNLTKPFDLLIKNIEKLPGGAMLSQALGLNDIADDIRNNIANEIRQSMDNGASATVAFGKAAKSTFSKMGSAMKTVFSNPLLLSITAIIALLYVAYKQWGKFMDAAKGVRDQTGLTAADSLEIAKTARGVATEWGQIGVDMEVAGKSASALVNEFQIAAAANEELVTGVGVMVGTLGVAEGSAAKVARMFEVMKGASGATTKQMAAAVSNAAKLGGVAPAKVFEDMAQSTKEIQTYFKGSFTAAAKAAIELRRMGTSIKEAAASAKSMVDFESSIGAELEASVLLGRQLDFGAARYYAFMGDIENQQKAVLKQVGSLEQFNKMMPFQKEAIAKAAGMEVDQLANMLKQQKILAGMDSKKKKEYEDGLALLENMQEVNADTLLIENQRLFAQEKMKKIWDTILIALAPIFDVVYDALEVISDIIQGIQKHLSSGLTFTLLGIAVIFGSVLVMAVKKWGKAIADVASDKIAGKLGGGLFKKVIPDPKDIAGAETATGKMGGIGDKISGFFNSFGKIDWTSIGKFAVISAILIASLIGLAFALKQFEGVEWENLAMAGAALGGLAVVAFILGKGAANMIQGAVAVAILGASLIPLAFALSLMKDVEWDTLWIAAAALGIFAAAAIGLGFVLPLVALGAVAIVLLSGAILAFGFALTILEKGKGGMDVMIDGITRLGALGSDLFLAAAGIAAIGYALAAFGGGTVLAGIGSFIGNFLGGDPIAKLERLAAIGPNLNIAALAIKELSSSLSNISVPDIGDIDELSEIADVAVKAKYNAATNVNVAAPDNSGVIKKLDEMINRIESLEFKIDGQVLIEAVTNRTSNPGFAI